MAISENDIANKALRRLGVSQSVSDFRTDRGKEAKLILGDYDDAVDAVLRDAPWPFATQLVALALTTDVFTEWPYVYAYPADCVMFRRILTGMRRDSIDTEVKYRIVQVASQRRILTDWPDAVAEITYRETDVSVWDADFAEAVALYLAVLIAPGLMKADTFKLADRAAQLYQWRVATAKANAFNEERADEDIRSVYERSRD